MKKTLLAMLLLGGTVSMFGQTTPTGTPTTPTTGNPSTTTPTTTSPATTSPTTTPTNDPTMGNPTNTPSANTNVNTTTNTMNNTSVNGNWNGVNASTSWTPETAPSYGWNSYSVWGNSGSLYPTTTAGGFPIAQPTTDASASMNSTGSYNAYGGTAVSALPGNVQTRFNQDFPAGVNNSYTWNQYGDWFHTHYTKDGRLWQYYYSTRGDGYALALPVLQTYVPENIVNGALQKYGSSLYSIGMVKTNSGNNAYQIGLIQKGQVGMQYLDDAGVTVADVWRVEDSASMNATQSNAAMDNGSSSTSTDASHSATTDPATTDANMQADSDMNGQPADKSKGKSKLKIKHADGSETKIKTKDGETKVKTKPADNSSNTPDNQQ